MFINNNDMKASIISDILKLGPWFLKKKNISASLSFYLGICPQLCQNGEPFSCLCRCATQAKWRELLYSGKPRTITIIY